MAVALALALSALPACGVGEIGGPGGGGGDPTGGPDAGPGQNAADAAPNAPDAAPPDYSMTVIPTGATTLTLGTATAFQIALVSERFVGPVELSVTGAPGSWNVRFEPSATAVLAYDGTATIDLIVEVPTNGDAGEIALSVDALAAPGVRSQPAALVVSNELIVDIAAGTGSGTHAFPSRSDINVGTVVTIRNSDTTAHRIHSNNDDQGFPHQPDDMGQGESYSVTITGTGELNYYCHVHEVVAGVGQLRAQ
ncbi:MAG TPA: hypothetical protein VML75_00535 [Kofleriaceae bacterium]|nr:hypothetical protein [Kofleriaceae bacterium]